MALQHGAFALFPVALTLQFMIAASGQHVLGIDFKNEYWVAGHRVLHGLNPYDLGWQRPAAGIAFPYAPLDALLFAPVSLIPRGVASAGFAALSLGALLLTLRVLGVRDWRIYGVVMMWAPVLHAWQTANITALLVLGIALMWRHRDVPMPAGALFGLLVTAKLFVWPIALWLVATRRLKHLGWAITSFVTLNVVSWTIVGFDQISPYRALLSKVTHIFEAQGYSVLALGLRSGLGRTDAYMAGLVVASALAAACLICGLLERDVAALTLSIAVSLAATPVIWLHYFTLLVIPLAIVRPRLSPIWILPLVTLAAPTPPSNWQIILVLTVTAAVICVAVRGRQQPIAGVVQVPFVTHSAVDAVT